MPDALTDKTAVVTGAGSGIGRATAILFAAEGAVVGVIDRDPSAAKETVEKIRLNGGQATALIADVTSAQHIDSAFAEFTTSSGGLDVVCNCAGVLTTGTALDASEEDWDRCLAVNAKGTFLSCRAAIPAMASRGGGSIINIASVAGLRGQRGFAAYSASKGAVISLTRSLAIDFGGLGIRANVVCPGAIPTPMTDQMFRSRGDGDLTQGMNETIVRYPLRKLGTPEDIAQAALYLASDAAGHVTGSTITVDGGLTAQ